MKAIKLIARQTLASYRKPSSIKIKETYPLPPYSTVIGMIHVACGYKEYIDMELSIQGTYHSRVNEMYTKYEFKPGYYDKDRHLVKITGKKDTGIVSGPANVELLTNVNLVIHIKPKKEEKLEEMYKKLIKPEEFLSLGRREDLLVIEKVEIVDIEEIIVEEDKKLNQDAYVPIDSINSDDTDDTSTIYKLNKKYVINEKTGLRYWEEQILAKYFSKNSYIYKGAEVMTDGKDILFFA